MVKSAFTTRRVPTKDMQTIVRGALRPRSGDLVLARVDHVGKQRRIERPDGRKALLFVGDEIIVCYGNRYAPDQFEALVGDDLGPCDLVAAGGIAAHELSRHDRMIAPTKISPIGLVGDAISLAVCIAVIYLTLRRWRRSPEKLSHGSKAALSSAT